MDSFSAVFAWAPASILVIIAVITLWASVSNLFEVPYSQTLEWVLFSLGGIIGYIALSCISFNIKMNTSIRLTFLISGCLSLLYVW